MSNPPKIADLSSKQARNARLIIAGQTSSKLADLLCNAKTVLTWLMGVVGAPPALTALLVPIRESGSMLTQAFISGFVKKSRKRKRIYTLGAIGQALCLVAMGLSALVLEGVAAGWAIVISLIFLSLARCLCSIASKDILGKTIPKGARGRISGTASSISGFIGLGAAMIVIFGVSFQGTASSYAWLILVGAIFYVGAALLLGLVSEENSKEHKASLFGDLKGRLAMVWHDHTLRRFVVVRTLLLGSALASPYLVILSQQEGFELRSLAAFVLAGGLASALSSPFWGTMSDRSSRHTMILGGVIAGVIGLTGAIIATSLPTLANLVWVWPTLFFLMNLGYAGVRIGRKTYVVDISGDEKRTDYVSASNTIIAVMILVLGGLASVLQSLHPTANLYLFSILCLMGSAVVLRLPKVHLHNQTL